MEDDKQLREFCKFLADGWAVYGDKWIRFDMNNPITDQKKTWTLQDHLKVMKERE